MQLELDNLVTLHMRSRKFSSRACHAQVSRVLAGLADVAFGRAANLLAEGQVLPKVVSAVEHSLGVTFTERMYIAYDCRLPIRLCPRSFSSGGCHEIFVLCMLCILPTFVYNCHPMHSKPSSVKSWGIKMAQGMFGIGHDIITLLVGLLCQMII